jgi:predicted RNA-binding protein with PUA domain
MINYCRVFKPMGEKMIIRGKIPGTDEALDFTIEGKVVSFIEPEGKEGRDVAKAPAKTGMV